MELHWLAVAKAVADPHSYEGKAPRQEFKAEDKVRRARAQCLNVVQDSSSQEAMDRAAQWLSYCVENDEACELANHDDFAPRRLIDVGPPDGSRGPVLVETNTKPPRLKQERYK
ncbi:hypothetical protein OQA88_8617 [Cercophora sp. LCS_1]